MKLALLALALVSVPAFAAETYDCSLTVVEDVNVLKIEYSKPANVEIDFKKGVPAEYVKSTTLLNEGIFNGDYSLLGYSAGDNGTDGAVLYTTDYRHPAAKFSFSTEIIPSECNPNVPYTYQCYLKFLDEEGTDQVFGFEQEVTRFDSTDAFNSRLTGWVNAYVDTRDNSLVVSANLMRLGFGSDQHSIMFDGTSQVALERPTKIRMNTFVMSGYHNIDNLGDISQGDSRTDSVEVNCQVRGR